MRNMKISMKLITSFAIVIVLALVVGAVGIFGMYSINEADNDLYHSKYLPTVRAGDISEIIVEQRVYMRNFVIYDVNADADTFNAAKNGMVTSKQEMDALMKEYDATISNPEDRSTFNEFSQVYNNKWLPTLSSIEELGTQNKTEEAKKALTEASLVAATIDELTTKLQDINLADGEAAVNNNTKLFITMTTMQAIMLLAAVAIAVFLVFYISGLISKPVSKLADAARKLAVGDVNMDIKAESRDEVGILCDSFVEMIESIKEQAEFLGIVSGGDFSRNIPVRSEADVMNKAINDMINANNSAFTEINQSSLQVSTGASQVAQGAQNLAQGSTEQAASIEELSATISEVYKQTQQNSEGAQMAADLTKKAGETMNESMESMKAMLEAMHGISEASENISKIIKTIDDIAFQTNILALNAAVEAARAGQHGKGFAVVADEVRNLAAKSAAAAKETSSLIEGSTQRVSEGNQIVDRTNSSLSAVAEYSRQTAESISEIAAASREQEVALAQINEGVDQISSVVQTNTATAEESAAAAEEMSSQSALLTSVVGRFKLKSTANSPSYGFAGNTGAEPMGISSPSSSSGFSLSDKY